MYTPTPTDLILLNFYQKIKCICEKLKQQVQDYIEKFKQDKLRPPCSCPICRKGTEFKFHGIYYRNLLCILFNFKGIPIIRYKCLSCGKTFADIPEFIEKEHHYAKSIICFLVKKLSKYSPQELHDIIFEIIDKESLQTKEQIRNNTPSPNNNTSKKVFRIENITELVTAQTISITTLYNWKQEFISI